MCVCVCVCVYTNMPIRTVAEAFAQKDVREVLRQMEMLLCDMGVEGSKSLRSLFLCVFLCALRVFLFFSGCVLRFFPPGKLLRSLFLCVWRCRGQYLLCCTEKASSFVLARERETCCGRCIPVCVLWVHTYHG